MRFILAVSDDDKIAIGGQLPWRISHDLKWFKMNTMGCPIVMGRKTWDSIGRKPLPFRENVVLSRQFVPNAKTFLSLRTLKVYLNEHKHAWVIGGAEVCHQLWKKGDILVLTRVHVQVDGGLKVYLPRMKTLWSKSFDGYTFSINKLV
tara:strand:+ start:538 stop:981 length:444 start_codon:yes stop_codon:yes gene_type:complete